MCYGSLDPNYMMRDIEARMRVVPVQSGGALKPQPASALGLLAWLGALRDGLRQKEPEHV